MYDKIFKPKKIELLTGEVVEEKVSRTWIYWIIIIIIIGLSVLLTNFDFSALSRRGGSEDLFSPSIIECLV